MGELTEVLGSLGHEDVVTYIRSGNVVFRSGSADGAAVAAALERAIAERFGLAVTVLLRTPAELGAVAGANPFPAAEKTPAKLHVVFLDGVPDAPAVAALDPERSAGDRFAVSGSEIYLELPSGARSYEADARLVRAPTRGERDRPELEHARQADRTELGSSGRVRPPTRSETWSKPALSRMLTAIDER